MRIIGTALLALALLAAACGGDDFTDDGADPEQLLRSAAEAMADVETASFRMERRGAPVTIEGMAFDGATGQYSAPDSARAILRGRAGDLAVELGTISTEGRTWLTNPLTGEWELIDSEFAFNPAVIFDADTGWPALLGEITDLEYVGRSGDVRRIRGTVSGERIEALMAGLAAAEPTTLTMDVDVETSLLVRVEFDTTGEGGVSSWVIELDDYGEPVTIEPPTTE